MTEGHIQQLSMFRVFSNIMTLFTSVNAVDVKTGNTRKERLQKYNILKL